jgi:hypothetical protein
MHTPDTSHITTARPRPKKRNAQPGRPSYLKDPRDTREGEAIGGGFFVFRRGQRTGRIRAPEWPFEHPTLSAAYVERDRLAALHPGETFIVVAERP